MSKKLLVFTAFLISTLLLPIMAFAVTISWEPAGDPSSDPLLVFGGSPSSYATKATITIGDNEQIESATLTAYTYDDGGKADGTEKATITIDNTSYANLQPTNQSFTYVVTTDVQDGTLDFNIESTQGDFYFGRVVLDIQTSLIPLPSTVLLLGTGLIGLAALGRRRRRK